MTPAVGPKGTFLVLTFRLPETPSRYRVSVWRRLRRAGATVVHRALFTLPDTPLNRLRALDIAHDVETWGGSAWMFLGESLDRERRTHSSPRSKGPRAVVLKGSRNP